MSNQPQANTRTGLTRASTSSGHSLLDSATEHSNRISHTRSDCRPPTQRLLHSIIRPFHSGIGGPFANDWLRTAFVEALVEDERLPDVVTTQHDLNVMLSRHPAAVTDEPDPLGGRLSVFDTLEDSIEHLEAKADHIRAGNTAPTTIWITAPGDNTDVIHQTIDYWAGLDLIALLRGHWPHGPNRRPHPVHWPTTITHSFSPQPPQEAFTALQEPGKSPGQPSDLRS